MAPKAPVCKFCQKAHYSTQRCAALDGQGGDVAVRGNSRESGSAPKAEFARTAPPPTNRVTVKREMYGTPEEISANLIKALSENKRLTEEVARLKKLLAEAHALKPEDNPLLPEVLKQAVTENASNYGNALPKSNGVTKKGRPNSGNALSNAAKQRRYRERKKVT